jgi:hypothetical protein
MYPFQRLMVLMMYSVSSVHATLKPAQTSSTMSDGGVEPRILLTVKRSVNRTSATTRTHKQAKSNNSSKETAYF